MFQIYFMVCQSFNKSTVTPKVFIIYQKYFFKLIQNLFLNFQKFEKIENEKSFLEIIFFYFSSVWLLKQRALVLKHQEIVNT